jgi:hypothetical protein
MSLCWLGVDLLLSLAILLVLGELRLLVLNLAVLVLKWNLLLMQSSAILHVVGELKLLMLNLAILHVLGDLASLLVLEWDWLLLHLGSLLVLEWNLLLLLSFAILLVLGEWQQVMLSFAILLVLNLEFLLGQLLPWKLLAELLEALLGSS